MIVARDEEVPNPPAEAELLGLIRAHWQKHRPLTFSQLQRSNYLEEALQTAVNLTQEAMQQLTGQQRMTSWEAWTLVREEWALLPAEESLEMDPANLPTLLEGEDLAEDQNSAVVIVVDSRGTRGFAWPVYLVKFLRTLGGLVGRK